MNASYHQVLFHQSPSIERVLQELLSLIKLSIDEERKIVSEAVDWFKTLLKDKEELIVNDTKAQNALIEAIINLLKLNRNEDLIFGAIDALMSIQGIIIDATICNELMIHLIKLARVRDETAVYIAFIFFKLHENSNQIFNPETLRSEVMMLIERLKIETGETIYSQAFNEAALKTLKRINENQAWKAQLPKDVLNDMQEALEPKKKVK